MSKHYYIYPTLLDKFQNLLDYDTVAGEPWNAEKPVKQVYDELEQELLDAINRVPQKPSPSADRGTALNEVVDQRVSGFAQNRGVSITTNGENWAAYINDAIYYFPFSLVNELSQELCGSICQRYMETTEPYGEATVHLYGFCDYWKADTIIDLKTTSQRGEFGKYADKWQRYVYPFIATNNGNTVSEMEFLIVELGKIGSNLTPYVSREIFTYDHAEATYKIMTILDRFIRWLEVNSPRITDTKIIQLK